MLEHVQILNDNQGQSKFAVIDFNEFQYIKNLLVDEKKLQNYLDYLHMQQIKIKSKQRIGLKEIKKILNQT